MSGIVLRFHVLSHLPRLQSKYCVTVHGPMGQRGPGDYLNPGLTSELLPWVRNFPAALRELCP